jgi:bacterioferritin (cytochrome b1)
MEDIRKELINMLNHALELEHAARIQYLSHAELISGPNAEKIVERLKEIASDEEKHEQMFRNLIGSYLGGVPAMSLAMTHTAENFEQILDINIKNEKEAIDFYKEIYHKVIDNKEELQYEFERLEHDVRHIILDEQEHVVELSLLFAKEYAAV